jgi:hypothetical protein
LVIQIVKLKMNALIQLSQSLISPMVIKAGRAFLIILLRKVSKIKQKLWSFVINCFQIINSMGLRGLKTALSVKHSACHYEMVCW